VGNLLVACRISLGECIESQGGIWIGQIEEVGRTVTSRSLRLRVWGAPLAGPEWRADASPLVTGVHHWGIGLWNSSDESRIVMVWATRDEHYDRFGVDLRVWTTDGRPITGQWAEGISHHEPAEYSLFGDRTALRLEMEGIRGAGVWVLRG
jgi:hypothetical protein